VKGYEVNALDFIVKPVSYGAFSLRMAKALRVMRENRGSSIAVKTRGGMEVLRLEDVTYIEVMNHALTYHRTDGEPVVTRSTITEAEESLADKPFVRINKSFLVNMRHIASVHGQEVELFSGEVLPIGRSMRKAAVERIAAYLGSMG
jgi:DNA-binding LytR/AlgR family response regulator